MPQDQVMIRSYGCVDYLAKPFSSTELIETVERCVAARRLIAA
jgi:FixJ family two-component response regulator